MSDWQYENPVPHDTALRKFRILMALMNAALLTSVSQPRFWDLLFPEWELPAGLRMPCLEYDYD
jgi:hypothetical protein